jgi:hypothetical protein
VNDDVLEEVTAVGDLTVSGSDDSPLIRVEPERAVASSSTRVPERDPEAAAPERLGSRASEATASASPVGAGRASSRSETRELTSFRTDDGTWHAHYRDSLVTLCGLAIPGFKPGRRRQPTCSDCTAAARALPVEQTPAFWGWRPVVTPPRPRVAGTVDPAVRPDGRCVVCGKKRKPERSRTYAKHLAELDPFCSTECCREYHGVERGTRSVSGPVPRGQREAA